MEALLEKEGDVENWNDERMDELSRRMDAGFKEMRDGFATVNQEVKKVHAGLAELATRKEVQAVDDRIFMLICSLFVVIGGIIGTLIVVNG
ncbi:MAG TPA: hypothetical protein VLK37_06045 [Solirubrobacterales bacterium]|nr:hypothetical protein [Solirubrobacterales bacterium]